MKKSKKIVLRILPIFIVLVVMLVTNGVGQVLGSSISELISPDVATNPDTTDSSAIAAINRIWGIILTILQIASVAAVVFAGVKYMFASADQKADIKKSLSILALGAILVFGASTVIQFLTGAFKEIAGQ